MEALEKLISVSSNALHQPIFEDSSVPSLLRPLLAAKNGFFAFESSLYVRPWGGGVGSVEWWNSEQLWRKSYGDATSGLTFFAEDVFGFQFAVNNEEVVFFDPEIAEIEHFSVNIEGWAEAILEDLSLHTGYPLAHQWQLVNGPIPIGYRLAPPVPFFLGGTYDVEQLRAKPDIELMNFRGDVYMQVKDLPDGAQVELKINRD